jgi:hypothetical protein
MAGRRGLFLIDDSAYDKHWKNWTVAFYFSSIYLGPGVCIHRLLELELWAFALFRINNEHLSNEHRISSHF